MVERERKAGRKKGRSRRGGGPPSNIVRLIAKEPSSSKRGINHQLRGSAQALTRPNTRPAPYGGRQQSSDNEKFCLSTRGHYHFRQKRIDNNYKVNHFYVGGENPCQQVARTVPCHIRTKSAANPLAAWDSWAALFCLFGNCLRGQRRHNTQSLTAVKQCRPQSTPSPFPSKQTLQN